MAAEFRRGFAALSRAAVFDRVSGDCAVERVGVYLESEESGYDVVVPGAVGVQGAVVAVGAYGV